MLEQSQLNFDRAQAACEVIPIADAQLSLYADAFSTDESDHYLDTLIRRTPWRHDDITIHGRTIPLPRLQAWYGEKDAVLRYSGMSVPPLVWTDDLLSIRNRVASVTGLNFNAVLLNYYRDGKDSVGWHSDDEREFGPHPIIASVSFGASREFVLKHSVKAHVKNVKCTLTHGSLLVMGDTVQNYWKHQLPKTRRVTAPRINLTFRNFQRR